MGIWHEFKLDELGKVGRGKSRHRPRNAEHLYNGNYPFIQTGDVQKSKFRILEFNKTYNEDGLAQSKLWSKGTLCISIVGANTAESAILGFDACFPDSVIGFNAFPDKTSNYFMKYYLDIMKLKMKKISEGAARENLSMEKLLSITLRIPDLNTQKKIEAILTGYDNLIENNSKKIKLLEEMAQITYEKWFVRLHFPKYETTTANPETGLPEGWVKININKIYRIKYGKNLPQTKILVKGKYPVYGASGKMGFYNESNSSNKIALITSRGNGSADVHRTYEEAFVTNNSFMVIPQKDYQHLSLAFTLELLKTAGLKNYCSGAAQPQLTNDSIKGLHVVLPSKGILEKFNEKITPCIEAVDILLKQNILLSEARDILLPRLMTGMIDVEQYNPSDLLKEVA